MGTFLLASDWTPSTRRQATNWICASATSHRQTRDKPVVRARRGRRGPWVSDPAELPCAVLDAVGAIRGGKPIIYSSRSWETWCKADLGGVVRRHKGKADVVSLTIEVGEVAERTGTELCVVEVLPYGHKGATGCCKLILPSVLEDFERALERARGFTYKFADMAA